MLHYTLIILKLLSYCNIFLLRFVCCCVIALYVQIIRILLYENYTIFTIFLECTFI
ncbi:hypothetical protein [Pseudomonas phage vB_Pa-PAC2]